MSKRKVRDSIAADHIDFEVAESMNEENFIALKVAQICSLGTELNPFRKDNGSWQLDMSNDLWLSTLRNLGIDAPPTHYRVSFRYGITAKEAAAFACVFERVFVPV